MTFQNMQTLAENSTTSNGLYMMPEMPMENTDIQKKESGRLWDEPERFRSDPQEHIDPDYLPKVFAEMCLAISESLSVHFDMVAAAGLGFLSICCNRHQVCLKDGWFQPLTLYMVGCAEAGERKSPVLAALKKPLDDWVGQRNADLKPQVAESRQRYKNLKNQLKRAEKDAENGKPGAEEKTLEIARELDDFQEVRPVRLYSGDVTSEKLAGLLQENNERFAILSAEGGILNVLSGDRYGSGIPNTDIYCQGFNGESVGIDRINSGTISLDHPVLSMLLFVQPVILAGLLGNKTLRGVGLVDRCLFFSPESGIGKERFDTDPVSQKIEAAFGNMVKRLLNEEQSRTLRLSAEARVLYSKWYDEFTKSIPLIYGDLTGWASKYRGTVGRIAGILQMCEDGSDLISEQTMYSAILISDYFAEQARSILREGSLNRNERLAKYIIGRIKSLEKKTLVDEDGQTILLFRTLMQNVHKSDLRYKKDYTEPLQVLIDKGYIDLDGDDFERATKILINPSLFNNQEIA